MKKFVKNYILVLSCSMIPLAVVMMLELFGLNIWENLWILFVGTFLAGLTDILLSFGVEIRTKQRLSLIFLNPSLYTIFGATSVAVIYLLD